MRRTYRASRFPNPILYTTISLTIALLVGCHRYVGCEAKEIDWSDFGVALNGPRAALAPSSSSNLRILVSPQRRMTKSYEFEYQNSSSPVASGPEDTTNYVIPGSSNSGYITQPVAPSHSSAYSALSASLASLKNRLSARGVTLSGSLAESNGSSLYPSSGSTYGLLDSQQPQTLQLTSQPSQQQSQQPTYLSVGQQDSVSRGYASSHNQNHDNKTIVLAIPAKINFLTDGSSQSKQQHQPQSSSDQSTRAEYSGKQQIDGTIDQSRQLVGTGVSSDQEHQYVIVNSPSSPSNDHAHIVSPVAASTSGGQSHGAPIYSPVYPTGSFSMKYIPSYQTASVHQPTVQKLYATVDHAPVTYESDQVSAKYSSCLDTCNSADPRWRKYTISKYKYCCSRSSQYDPQFESPSAEKVSDVSSKYAEDAYYSYLYRRSRARRPKKSRPSRYHRYTVASTSSAQDDDQATEVGTSQVVNRPAHHESPYMRYHKSRQQAQTDSAESARDSAEGPSVSSTVGGYSPKERAHRRGRSRDFDNPEVHLAPSQDTNEEPELASYTGRGAGYGNADYSVDGRYSGEEDLESRSNYDDLTGPEKSVDGASDYPIEGVPESQGSEDDESDNSYKHSISYKRRKYGKGKSRRGQTSAKDTKYYKKGRKNSRHSKENPPSQVNGTDYDSTQIGDQYNHESQGEEDAPSYHKDSSSSNGESGDSEQALSSLSKYKASLNESTVAHLSKTTMHLKEILSLLEKKAQLRSNDTGSSVGGSSYTSSSTPPPPVTTTNLYSPTSLLGPQYAASPLVNSFSNEYLASELGLKSPYRYESPPAYTSSLSSPTIGLPPSYGPLSSDNYASLSAFHPNQYSVGQMKHMPSPHLAHQRRKRMNKNGRYNNLMLQKPQVPLGSTSSLLHAAGKSALLNNPYYAALQYPYWYNRGNSPSVTNSYPYKNIHKSPYTSLLSGPVSSKLAAVASSSLYSDESRYNGVASYDPLTNAASSLRSSTVMRLRPKPFVYQPHVLPIYTRHSVLSSSDVKA